MNSESPGAPAVLPSVLRNAASRLKVLAVDDSSFSRKLLEHALAGEPYELLFAADGSQAMKIFERDRPDIVITDWMLPDITGPQLCQRIRAEGDGRYTYVLLLTSNVEKEKIVEGFEAGADDYLTKPFHAKELEARVRAGRRIVEMQRTIEEKNRLLEHAARTDFLTELPNRRAAEEYGRKQLKGAIRHGFSIWVILADLNKFKLINDKFGHLAGDEVLKRFAAVLKKNTRVSDVCARMGGDEFILIVTHADRAGVMEFVGRLQRGFANEKFTFSSEVSSSFGIAGFIAPEQPAFDLLLERADAALYESKTQGAIHVRTDDAGRS